MLLFALNYAPAQSPGDTVGVTEQDLQTICSAGHRVALDAAGGAHVVWMGGYFPAPRSVYYNYIDPQRNILYPLGTPIGNGGYPQIAVNSNNQPGAVFHDLDSLTYWTPSGRYHPPGDGYWPALSFDQNDRVQLIYGVSGLTPEIIIDYTRSNNGGPNWTTPVPVDTTNIPSYTITSSPVSNKVAMVYLHSIDTLNSWENDVYYIQSANGIIWPWQNGKINITHYGNGPLFAAPDLDAVYDYNDNLHVIWNVTYSADSLVTVFVFHYDQLNQTIVEVAHVVTPFTAGCDWGAWGLPVSKMSIGTSGDNVLFVTYSRFDTSDCSACGYANGEIFVQYSGNGISWSAPANLTNSHTPFCLAGDCDSDHWSSLAARIDDNLHIIYVNDKDAGGSPQTECAVTDNPMLYLRYPISQLSVGEPDNIPMRFEILSNYPNPFNASTVISYRLEKESLVGLGIYDIRGKLVQALLNGVRQSGDHSFIWEPHGLSSGVYFCCLTTSVGRFVRKLTFLK
jgi:hypothetical protein